MAEVAGRLKPGAAVPFQAIDGQLDVFEAECQ